MQSLVPHSAAWAPSSHFASVLRCPGDAHGLAAAAELPEAFFELHGLPWHQHLDLESTELPGGFFEVRGGDAPGANGFYVIRIFFGIRVP